MVNGLHSYRAFVASALSKRFTILPNIHPFTHRRRCQPCKATASSSGAVRGRCLTQGHLDTKLGGAGDQTSNLPVTSQPALPPEPHAAQEAALPPENTLVLVLSKARQKMLDRCSPFSLTGLVRPWMAFSMCHRSTRRSSPPVHEDSPQQFNTVKTLCVHNPPHITKIQIKLDTVPRKTACKLAFWILDLCAYPQQLNQQLGFISFPSDSKFMLTKTVLTPCEFSRR